MDMNTIGTTMLLIYDELKNDKKSKKLIDQIDRAQKDEDVKKGIVAAVARLRELGKTTLADEIVKNTKGFAF